MRFQSIVILNLVASLASLLAACGTADNTPTEAEYDDVAKSVGSLVVAGGAGGEVASMEDSIHIAMGAMPVNFVLSASGECHGSRLGLDYSYQFTCEDEAGDALEVCDETTDSAEVAVAWSGEVSAPPRLSVTVERTGGWSITGIQSGTATFNGDGSFDFTADVQTATSERSYDFHFSASYEEIMLDVSTMAVQSGSIRYDIAADHHVMTDAGTQLDSSFVVSAEVTFETDGTATIVLDGERTYHLDTETGEVTGMTSGSWSSS